MNKSNLGDMLCFSNKRSDQPPPESSFWNAQPPHGSSSVAVGSSNLDLSLHASHPQNIPIASYSRHQAQIPFNTSYIRHQDQIHNEKYIYNPEASTNFSPHQPPIVFMGPRHPTIFYPKKQLFGPLGEMPLRFSSPALLPNPHQSRFYNSEQPKPSRYQQPPGPFCPQQPTGVFSHQQLTVAHRHQQPTMAHSQQPPTEVHKQLQSLMAHSQKSQQMPTETRSQQQPTEAHSQFSHQQPTMAYSQQQPIMTQSQQPPTEAHSQFSHQQPTMTQRHPQPIMARNHQKTTMAQGHRQPTVSQGFQQSTSFPFQKPRPLPPSYRYPLPHQRHPQPAHQTHLQLTPNHQPAHQTHLQLIPNPFNMSSIPQYYQNIRRRVISDMNYRNLKSRSFREEFGGKNRADIGLTSYSSVSVIQKVCPSIPEQNILPKSKKIKHVGSVNLNLDANDNDELNKTEEEFHLMKSGQELARMCFSVEVGCQTDLSFPLDVEIVMMPVEALNGFITAPQQGGSARNVVLKPETPKSETTTTMDVTDESATVVKNKECFQESHIVVPLYGDQLQDSTRDDKNPNPDHHIKVDSKVCEPKLFEEQECSQKESVKTDSIVILKASMNENSIKQNRPTSDLIQMSQGEQNQRKRPQCPNLDFNVSLSLEEQSVSEKPNIQDFHTKRESKVTESKQEKINCDNPTRDSEVFGNTRKTSPSNLIKDIEDPKSKPDADSQSGSCYFTDFVNSAIEDEVVESFNPLANFATLMSYTDPDIEAELWNMSQNTSMQPGAKLFEQHYSEEAYKVHQNILENASNSEQVNSEKANLNDQYNSENVFYSEQDNLNYAFHSEQDNPRNALHSEQFHSEQYTSENTYNFEQDMSTSALYSEHYYRENTNYSGRDKLIDSISEIPCQSNKEPSLDQNNTESLVCRANSPSTSIAISQEPINVLKSSHISKIICKNPKSKNTTSQDKFSPRELGQSLNSSVGFQTDREDLWQSTSKKQRQSCATNSQQKKKLKQTSRRKYKVKNSTGINRKPDIVTRMSSDQYEHLKVDSNEPIEHKPRQLSEDMSKNWNMPFLDALNAIQKCGHVAGITSLKKENIQSSVRKQNEGQTQETVNECSSKSQEKRSSRGRLLKKKIFDDYDESTGESNSNECKDHHDREGKSLITSSEKIYSHKGFPFHSSINQEKYLKNEQELKKPIENISHETNAIDVESDEITICSLDPHDIFAENLAIKMASQGKFEGKYNSKEYVDETKSLQKSSLVEMSNISPKEVVTVNVLKSDVQLGETDSDPLKMEDKCKEPSEVFEVKVNESFKEDKSGVNTECLGDNGLSKHEIMSTEDFPSDANSSTIGKSSDETNCKMGNRVLRSASKPNYNVNHQEEKKSKEVRKKVIKEEENKSSLKKKFTQGKEMGKKNTSIITKQLHKVFLEVMKDSKSAEFYYNIDEARPMPMYYTIDNLEIDLKSVEMKLENDLYADAEQFLEDFRNIVKTSVDYFGPTHKISKRSRKLLDLASGLVSQRNLNLPSCPKFDLMEMLNNNNHPGVAKRRIRPAKRKIAEKSEIYSSTKIGDESPDHVCEECGTIFAHIHSYSRHCRAKSGCAKALNRGKQMIGHTMQTNHSPPRKIYESPERIHFNLDDLVVLATAPSGQGDQLLKALDREIVACKRTVQKNKFLSALRRKARDRDIEPYRVPFLATRSNARWTNHELLLAVQGVRNFGKNFQTIAQVLGTKTESQVRSFFVNYKRRFNLDSTYEEYIAEYATINDDEDMEVDKEKDGSRDVGSSKWSISHISNSKLRNETFTCKECNLQFSSEDALDDHIENDWPECGELFARDKPSGGDENDVSRNEVSVRHPPSPEATSSLNSLSRRKRIPKKHHSFIPSFPRGVPVSHPQDNIVVDADDDSFEPPGLQVRSFVNVNS